jgi:6-phosphogluconate dehydrogenase
MVNKNNKQLCALGMVGLGVMGRNLLLNMADHGFSVAGYDKDQEKVNSLQKESTPKQNIQGATTAKDFILLLEKPRAIMLLVPAGAAVDSVINELLPLLDKGDLIIDAGNSHFTDTNIRMQRLQELGIQFLGVGISGGEEGARHGPSIMPGGDKKSYERVRPILEAVAAKVNNDPCVTYLGNGSVGHYVKMVHNGIEYGIMQLIAETYDLLKWGISLTNEELHDVYVSWNKSELNSYLLEITSHIFNKIDDKTQTPLIDHIVGVAKQNGTGMWTSQSAMELQVPVPSIDLAVSLRDLSTLIAQREQAKKLYNLVIEPLNTDEAEFIKILQSAFFTSMIIIYAQGMSLLTVASEKYNYNLDLEALARIWRGGCIIRAAFLENICAAYHANKNLANLLLDGNIAKLLLKHQEGLRQIVCTAGILGIPAPTLMGSLSYFDAYRHTWQPANLIQAQRDYFGSHQYERINETGSFHTDWNH